MTTTLVPDLLTASIAADRNVDARYAVAGRWLATGMVDPATTVALAARADELEASHLRAAWLAEREQARAADPRPQPQPEPSSEDAWVHPRAER